MRISEYFANLNYGVYPFFPALDSYIHNTYIKQLIFMKY